MSELDKIRNEVLKVVELVLGMPYVDADPDVTKGIVWSSIQHIHIIIALEDSLNIHLTDSDLSEVDDFDSLVKIVFKRTIGSL